MYTCTLYVLFGLFLFYTGPQWCLLQLLVLKKMTMDSAITPYKSSFLLRYQTSQWMMTRSHSLLPSLDLPFLLWVYPSSTVGVAPTPLPVVPLRCVASVSCSSNLDDYLRGTDISVTISMDLRREQVNLINKYISV